MLVLNGTLRASTRACEMVRYHNIGGERSSLGAQVRSITLTATRLELHQLHELDVVHSEDLIGHWAEEIA